jgi:DNA repair and recombination protein RAD52
MLKSSITIIVQLRNMEISLNLYFRFLKLFLRYTGTPLLDHNNKPIPIAKMLATKPLRSEIQSRKGHGNSRVSYMSTDCVSRTLNDIFGFDGWTSEVLQVTRTHMEKNPKGQWLIVYEAKVRCTHKASGAFKEDIGVADSIHGQIQSAISNAIKAAVSDGLKRAARHFGDKLGNILYNEKFKASNAPLTLKDALIQYDIERAKSKFGFDNERNKNATDSNEATDTKAVCSTENANRTVEQSSNGLGSVTISTTPPNPTPLQKTNVNQSSNTKVQPSYANTMASNTSGDPSSSNPSSESIAQYGQGQKPQSTVAPSSTRQIPSVSLSVSGVDGNANSIAAPINAGNSNSNGVPRFQRQVNPPNQYANGYSSSYASQNSHYQTSGQSVERPLSLNAPPPPPFANRARSDVLNDISGTINTSSNTVNHGNASSSSKPIACSTNQPSNLDTNGINLNQLNVYSKRKLELSNEIPSIGAQKKMNANPYSKK